MNKTRSEAAEFARLLAETVSDFKLQTPDFSCEIALFPPFTAIEAVRKETEHSGIVVGAQNVFYEKNGAYTGAVSCAMLADAGCEMVIVGHSERRRFFGETDELAAKKTRAALQSGLKVILCVGETEKERNAGRAREVAQRQIAASLQNADPERTAVAYEPVWAIGTGKNAEIRQIEEMHAHIRETLCGISESFRNTAILYGGSVNPGNALRIARASNVDGMLVGTASLELDSFTSIIEKVLTD